MLIYMASKCPICMENVSPSESMIHIEDRHPDIWKDLTATQARIGNMKDQVHLEILRIQRESEEVMQRKILDLRAKIETELSDFGKRTGLQEEEKDGETPTSE